MYSNVGLKGQSQQIGFAWPFILLKSPMLRHEMLDFKIIF
jgi:hypothetical protein